MYKKIYSVGIAVYVFMLFLSVFFYKERIILLDTAFTVFNILKDNSFSIQVYRFGDVFSQMLPVLTRRLQLSLNTIILSYSAGFTLYYFVCYLICGSFLKQYRFSLAILLLNILFVSDTFYWITSQLPQAIALFMVVLAFLSNKHLNSNNALMLLVLILGAITVAFFHPLVLFIVVYAILFFAERKEAFADKRILYGIALVYFFAVILKAVLFRTTYEQHSLSGLKNFITQFPDYFTLYANKRFLYNCVAKYYWIPTITSAIIIFYTRIKEWKKLGLFVAFLLGYLMLINISYPTNATPEFYIESLYLPLSIFLGLPFIFDLLPLLEKRKMALPVIVLILLSGCLRIYLTHSIYTARLGWERNFMAQYLDKKVIVSAEKADTTLLQMLWGTPYEFCLLSSLEQHKTASIIIDNNPKEREWAGGTTKSLVVNWNVIPYSQLSTRYFHFTDTTSGYQIIK